MQVSQKSRWFIQLSCVLLFDIFISFFSLGFYHGDGFEFYSSTMFEQLGLLRHGFHFSKTGVEFALLSATRFISLLIGILIFKKRFYVDVFYQLLMSLFVCSISFSLVKILCFAETEGMLHFAGVWLHVLWNIGISVFFLAFLHHVVRLCEGEYRPVKKTQTAQTATNEKKENGDVQDAQETKKQSSESAAIRESSITQIIRLLSYTKYNGKYFLVGSIFLIIYSTCRIFLPYFTGEVIAQIVRKESYADGTFHRLVFTMLALVLIGSVFGGLRSSCFSYATSLVDRSVRRDLFKSIMQQEIAFFDQLNTGEVLSRLSSDCQLVSTIVSTNVNIFLRSLLMMIGSLFFMWYLSWRLTLITFIIIPPLAFFLKLYGVFYDCIRLGERTQKAKAAANHVAEEAIASIRTVKSFACEDKEVARYEAKLAKTLKVIQLKALAEIGFSWINEFAEYIVLLAILFYAGHLALQGLMTVNQITSFLLYQLQLGEVFYYMKIVFSSFMEGVGSSRKIFEYMHREPEIKINNKGEHKNIEGQVDFVDVSFSYPSRPGQNILKQITLQIKPKQTVAIVGPSGSGKSTIVALLEHFYESTSGKVTLDDTLIQEYNHKYYHQSVALVGQEPVLYSGSVRYNILYGCQKEVTDEQMFEAAKLANCHDFIMEMKEGYDTMIGEKGIQLSGGQRQRIAICRALVMNPRVLILDEATASLDTVSEQLIQESLRKCSSNRTVIIIAHRLSTVESADVIFVLNKGKLIQSGTHRSLSQEEGLYKRLVQRQVFEET
ncbi:ATP-binding cassette sub-family B member 9 [Aphelenchoides bicaudatus]|nr:ATP-binding cassette sub-family B member 9 [Aphelenchoides bicaudatus]